MSDFMWGITHSNPGRPRAKEMDRICREEGGYGFREVNVRPGTSPDVNNGRYQGWFVGPNYGAPHDGNMARRIGERIESECGGNADPDVGG